MTTAGRSSTTRCRSRNLFFNTGWTWAKDLTDTQNTNATFTGPMVQDQFNRRAERGNNVLTRPQRLYINAIYALPFGRDQRFGGGLNRVVDAMVGGWQMSWVGDASRPVFHANFFRLRCFEH